MNQSFKKIKKTMEGGSNGDLTNHVDKEEEEEHAQAEVWKFVFAFADIAVVKCAIELGIADVLESHGEPMTLSDLASALGCSQSSLYRVMRFLIHRHVFKQTPISQGTMGYARTPISRLLMKNGEKSLAPLLMLESSPVMLAPWHALRTRVLADEKPAFVSAHDKDVWAFTAADPAHSKLVDDAMACDARLVVPIVVASCPEIFHGVGTVVDVGGGNGTAMGILVKSCAWIKGINFDLPHVVAVAPTCVGVEHVTGDMFDVVPKADAAFIMWVLHDWSDQECIQILRNCREAIPKDKGKVIIVEAVVNDSNDINNNNTNSNHKKDELEYVRLVLDMVMMAHTNKGKERTAKEWDYVLTQAGFTRHVIIHIKAVQSVIVAFP